MHNSEEMLQHHLLDLLVDAPSSFAALYGGLVHNCGYPTSLDVRLIFDTLLEMEQQEMVKGSQMAVDGSFHDPTNNDRMRNLLAYQAWLPKSMFEELSVDGVGLWYTLTAKGRTEWERWSWDEKQKPMPQWMLDDLIDTQTLIIHAQNIQSAEEALCDWLSHNESARIVGNSRTVEQIPIFTLRNGFVITNGIKLVYQYV